jgi:hypothetical protein
MLTARRLDILTPTPIPIPIRDPEQERSDQRSSFWERAAVAFTVFVCFQIALLTLIGL